MQGNHILLNGLSDEKIAHAAGQVVEGINILKEAASVGNLQFVQRLLNLIDVQKNLPLVVHALYSSLNPVLLSECADYIYLPSNNIRLMLMIWLILMV